MNTVRFHDEARAELVHEVGFYTAVSRRLGERFDNAVKKAIYRAAAFPELGSPYYFGTRRRFPEEIPFLHCLFQIGGRYFRRGNRA